MTTIGSMATSSSTCRTVLNSGMETTVKDAENLLNDTQVHEPIR